jgi:PAS domain S-box-containing protein
MDTILSGITEAVWSCSADDLRITYINKASEYIFGYKPDELLGKSHTLLNSIHPDDRVEVDKEIAQLPRKGKATLAFRLYDKKGELKHILNEVVLNKDEYGRDMITGISIDTTENHNYQKRIEEQIYRLREIAEIQSHAIRGPVASIMGLAQLLHPERMDTANADIVRKMLTATTQLDNAIKDITDRANLFE